MIIGDPRTDKTEALLRAHGRFTQSPGGRYIPGVDAGTGVADLRVISVEAERVSCVRIDPSPMTTLGVLEGIRACARSRLGTGSLQGLTACVRGAGHVGASLVGRLRAEGAEVKFSEIDGTLAEEVANQTGATPLSAGNLLSALCDVFAPCAYGAVINDAKVPALRCTIVAAVPTTC